jgi:type I restriction enzyme S subunit
MYTAWVTSSAIASRLNPEFYRPEYTENECRLQKLADCRPLGELCDAKSPITNGIRGPDLAQTDFRMLRLQDVDELWMDSSKSLRVSERQYKANRRAECRKGDVLLAIGGYIGVVGKVVDDAPQTMGQHSARLRFDASKVDLDFMLVYLSSRSGKMLCQRYVTGGVQQGINLEDVRDIRVPVVDMAVQRAIGAKVREAERMYYQAKQLLDEARAEVMCLVDGTMKEDGPMHNQE